MRVPFVDLPAQLAEFEPALREAVARVFSSCAFSGGPEVERFERHFARYCRTAHAVGVSSGTAALEIALKARGIGAGDEVIVPALTFFATAEAVALTGATPVFADVKLSTGNLDPAWLPKVLTARTRAVIPVHLYGLPAEMDAILAFAREHRLFVLEDVSQAHGATISGRRAGSLGDAAAFSFYPSKNLGACGEAGAIVTGDSQLADAARMLRDHGSRTRYEHDVIGRNDRMDGLQAAILSAAMEHLDRWNDSRRRLAARYRERFGGDPTILPMADDAGDSVYHLFVVRLSGCDRDRVRAKLAALEIQTGVHYPRPLHRQRAFLDAGQPAGSRPAAERLAREVLSLPIYPQLQPEQVDYVAAALRQAVASTAVREI